MYKVIIALPPFLLKLPNKLRSGTQFHFQYITACLGREEMEINPDKCGFFKTHIGDLAFKLVNSRNIQQLIAQLVS